MFFLFFTVVFSGWTQLYFMGDNAMQTCTKSPNLFSGSYYNSVDGFRLDMVYGSETDPVQNMCYYFKLDKDNNQLIYRNYTVNDQNNAWKDRPYCESTYSEEIIFHDGECTDEYGSDILGAAGDSSMVVIEDVEKSCSVRMTQHKKEDCSDDPVEYTVSWNPQECETVVTSRGSGYDWYAVTTIKFGVNKDQTMVTGDVFSNPICAGDAEETLMWKMGACMANDPEEEEAGYVRYVEVLCDKDFKPGDHKYVKATSHLSLPRLISSRRSKKN